MAQANDTRQQLAENLRDAGCSRDITEECLAFHDAGTPHRMLPKLKEQRAALLGKLHQTEKELDCLDYLVHRIETTKV